MPNQFELERRYASYSNEQLLDLLNNRDAYTELAINVAYVELRRRNLSEEDIKEYIQSKFKKAEAFMEKNIYEDLSLLSKSFFYFCWIPFFTFPFKLNFQEDNLVLKLKQANYYSLFGFFFCAIGWICFEFLGLNIITAISVWISGMLLALYVDNRFNRDRLIRKFEAIIQKHQAASVKQRQKEDQLP